MEYLVGLVVVGYSIVLFYLGARYGRAVEQDAVKAKAYAESILADIEKVKKAL